MPQNLGTGALDFFVPLRQYTGNYKIAKADCEKLGKSNPAKSEGIDRRRLKLWRRRCPILMRHMLCSSLHRTGTKNPSGH